MILYVYCTVGGGVNEICAGCEFVTIISELDFAFIYLPAKVRFKRYKCSEFSAWNFDTPACQTHNARARSIISNDKQCILLLCYTDLKTALKTIMPNANKTELELLFSNNIFERETCYVGKRFRENQPIPIFFISKPFWRLAAGRRDEKGKNLSDTDFFSVILR